MSSADEDNHDNDSQNSKKRRVQRACDICRRKKIRCDGGQMPGNRCSNCIAYNFQCTYVEAARKRGPPKGYVESLENRLESMEKLLQKLCPDADFTAELGGAFDRDSWLRERAGGPSNPPAIKSSDSPSELSPAGSGLGHLSVPAPIEPDFDASDDESGFLHPMLTRDLKDLSLDPIQPRFFGKSSGVQLLQTAIDLKQEYSGEARRQPSSYLEHKDIWMNSPNTRKEFWQPRPFELAIFEAAEPQYDFPESDLTHKLIDAYFREVNVYHPLLHRPTFERSVREGLHQREPGFGATLLLVCAVASRYVPDDPRVYLESAAPGLAQTHSAGWKWFNQVQVVRKSLLAPPCLYDLQAYCLSVTFLQGSSALQACWTMVGIGIRLAQDVGAHRRKVYSAELTVEDELWKRACWMLVTLDRQLSCALGRPCAIQDEDFDIDMPVECDDEFWELDDPQLAFKQPPNKPSKVSFFICLLKLNQILAFAMRTIYSINKSKVLLGFVGQQWEQHIVAELDSALNKWIDAVPDHLRWDPQREDPLFFDQSAILYATYYNLQIIIHRPFIPSPRKPSPLSFPSLAICTNAARSCSHIIDILRARSEPIVRPNLMMPAFTSCIVLLLNIWGGKRSGSTRNPEKEMADVYKCMALLKECETQLHSAGRLWDILRDLASIGDLPLPEASPGPTFKRERDSDDPIADLSASLAASAPVASDPAAAALVAPSEPRSIAGTRRVSAAGPVQPARNGAYSLPLHTADLGRIPLHPAPGQVPTDPSASYASWYTAQGAAALGNVTTPQHGQSRVDPMFGLDPVMYAQMMNGFPDKMPQEYGAAYPNSTGMQSQGLFDDTMEMWSTAPSGFELDDWGSYITSAMAQSQP